MDLKAFDDYVGQRRIVSQLLPDLTACLQRNKTTPHMILHGRPGLGKDYLVERIAQFLGAQVHMYYGSEIARNRNWTWNTAFYALRSEDPNDIYPGLDAAGFIREPERVIRHLIVVNECETIGPQIWEGLHSSMIPQSDGRRVYPYCVNKSQGQYSTLWCPPYTLILLTNFISKLRKNGMAVVDRCSMVMQVQPYTHEEMQAIIEAFSEKNGVVIKPEAAALLSRCSKANPRRAIDQLWHSCDNERVLRNDTRITVANVHAVMDRMGIADDGLNDDDLNYLEALVNSSGGVGQDRLACILGTSVDALDSEIEPWLFQQGLVTVAAGTGRILTQDGLARVRRNGRSKLNFV